MMMMTWCAIETGNIRNNFVQTRKRHVQSNTRDCPKMKIISGLIFTMPPDVKRSMASQPINEASLTPGAPSI